MIVEKFRTALLKGDLVHEVRVEQVLLALSVTTNLVVEETHLVRPVQGGEIHQATRDHSLSLRNSYTRRVDQ